MNPALISLLALLAAIVLSMTSRINIGSIAIALAWLVGVYLAGLKPDAIIAGFPASLFLTLTGVTLLFACAETNGTLERLAERAVGLVRGEKRWLPAVFFLLACLISTVGPGAISSVALIIPLAMAIGLRAGVSPFLTSLMVANGANAGNLSPVSSVGVIANAKMAEAGLGGHEGKVWLGNFVAHALVAVVAYVFFRHETSANDDAATGVEIQPQALTRTQLVTVAVIACWILGVLLAKLNLGLSSFAAATLLITCRTADENKALKKVPWSVILMVSGVSLLIAMLEKTGGMELFTALLARLASAATVNGVIAFITGAISIYSSTSGVVLPAFLPIAPKLVTQIGGGDPLAIALSINIGSALVDVSPLSTLGALCVATIQDPDDAKLLFRRLLFWGFSMTLVGALLCQLLAGVLARV